MIRFATIDKLPPSMRKRLPGTRKPSTRKDPEHEAQVVLFNRIRTLAANDSRYDLLARRTFAIPNGGGRSKREAGRLKAEGVTAGVSDVMCAVASGPFHGLFIEMKSPTGQPTKEQRLWIADSIAANYCACVCRSADEAWTVWLAYAKGAVAP